MEQQKKKVEELKQSMAKRQRVYSDWCENMERKKAAVKKEISEGVLEYQKDMTTFLEEAKKLKEEEGVEDMIIMKQEAKEEKD